MKLLILFLLHFLRSDIHRRPLLLFWMKLWLLFSISNRHSSSDSGVLLVVKRRKYLFRNFYIEVNIRLMVQELAW